MAAANEILKRIWSENLNVNALKCHCFRLGLRRSELFQNLIKTEG